MSKTKKQDKDKIKKVKKIARQQLPLKNLQTKKIPSKKKDVVEEILKEEMKKHGQ